MAWNRLGLRELLGPSFLFMLDTVMTEHMEKLSPLQRLIRNRRSVRKYEDRSVEREKILTCIEAARLAPSAENVQPWRFVVIDDPETKETFCRAAFSGIYTPTRFAVRAPVIIAILAKKDLLANTIGRQIQGTSWYLIDIGIAGEHFVLQAEELGLATCWIGWFNAKKARSILRAPVTHKVVALIAMGYGTSHIPSQQKRHDRNSIVWFNTFKGEA